MLCRGWVALRAYAWLKFHLGCDSRIDSGPRRSRLHCRHHKYLVGQSAEGVCPSETKACSRAPLSSSRLRHEDDDRYVVSLYVAVRRGEQHRSDPLPLSVQLAGIVKLAPGVIGQGLGTIAAGLACL